MTNDGPTLDDVKAAIERLRREDRAMLRPWILARYDVRGYPAPGFAGSARAYAGDRAVPGSEGSGG